MKVFKRNLFKLGLAAAAAGRPRVALGIAERLPNGEAKTTVLVAVLRYYRGRFDHQHVFQIAKLIPDHPARSEQLEAILKLCVECGHLKRALEAAALLGRKLTAREIGTVRARCAGRGFDLDEISAAAKRSGRKLSAKEIRTIFKRFVVHGFFEDAIKTVKRIPRGLARDRLLEFAALDDLRRNTEHDNYLICVGLMTNGAIKARSLDRVIGVFVRNGSYDEARQAAAWRGRKLTGAELAAIAGKNIKHENAKEALEAARSIVDRGLRGKILKATALMCMRDPRNWDLAFDAVRRVAGVRTRKDLLNRLVAEFAKHGWFERLRGAAKLLGRKPTDDELVACSAVWFRDGCDGGNAKPGYRALGLVRRELTDGEVGKMIGG